MIEEIKVKTRAVGNSSDYFWLVSESERVDDNWSKMYKVFTNDEKMLNILVEIDDQNYKVSFDKILLPRKDFAGRNIYVKLVAEGKRGSESSLFMFNLAKLRLKDEKRLAELFAEEFSDDFVTTFFSNRDISELEKKLTDISKVTLEGGSFSNKRVSKENVFSFRTYDIDAFLSELELITNTNSVGNGTFALILCEKTITDKYFEQFNYKNQKFSKGLCFTTAQIPSTDKSIKIEVKCGNGLSCANKFVSDDEPILVDVVGKELGHEYSITIEGKAFKTGQSLKDIGIVNAQTISVDRIDSLKKYLVKVNGGIRANKTIDESYSVDYQPERGLEIIGYSVNGKSVSSSSIKLRDYIDYETEEINIEVQTKKKVYSIKNMRPDFCSVVGEASYGEKIKVNINVGKEVECVKYNQSRAIVDGNCCSFIMPDEDVNITVEPKKVLDKILIGLKDLVGRIEEWLKVEKNKIMAMIVVVILLIIAILIWNSNRQKGKTIEKPQQEQTQIKK